jgi:hypothetical protein
MSEDDDDLAKWGPLRAMIGFRAQSIEMGLLRVCRNPEESEISATLHDMELACRQESLLDLNEILGPKSNPPTLMLVKPVP